MASTRLTKDLRWKIHNALMKRAYVERKLELDAMEHELALAVYNDLYSQAERELLSSAPKKFFAKQTSLSASFNGAYQEVKLADELPFANKDVGVGWRSVCVAKYDGDHELTAKYAAWDKPRKQYDEDWHKLNREAEEILDSCSTVKKLCEIWPEVCPLLQELGISVEAEKCMLPAIRQDMNQLFKLPPEAFAGA